MFQRIFVPLDGSARAEQALPVAARLARAAGGTVVLLRVVSVANEFVAYMTLEPIPMPITINAAVAEARHYLKHVVQTHRLTDLQIESDVVVGPAATTILSMANSSKSDLIVMCSHGYTGVTRWALGSVAEKVAHHATIPILLLRAGGVALVSSHPSGESLRVLVPLDGSASARTAIVPAAHLIAALSGQAQGTLHLTRVVPPPHIGAMSLRERDAMLQAIKQELSSTAVESGAEMIAAGITTLKQPITWSITLNDDIAVGIINMAEHGEVVEGTGGFGRCDAIAMTTHGRGAFQRWMMGSITQRVLHASKLPLLIVQPPDTTDKGTQ